MDCTSVFEIFKAGIGPSSSHTMGPWLAASYFVKELQDNNLLDNTKTIKVHLYGSLAKTGKGHATDIAVQMGLSGHQIDSVSTQEMEKTLETISNEKTLSLGFLQKIKFNPKEHILFHKSESLPFHPNGIRFEAIFKSNASFSDTYFSVGGGFVTKGEESEEASTSNTSDSTLNLPYPIISAESIIQQCTTNNLPIWALALANEKMLYSNQDDVNAVEQDIYNRLQQIWTIMRNCAHKGCYTSGMLPGVLKVVRRAYDLNKKLLDAKKNNEQQITDQNTTNIADPKQWLQTIQQGNWNFNQVSKWISCFALAINEENAAFGKVVTAPTNGAAGVIPAVMLYYYCFEPNVTEKDLAHFLLVAGQIGILFKNGATISAAMGGCQAEIGVSSAMAAAGLTECRGGTPAQSLMAAEIAMEHHLGLTCDPIAGLVQIPCIERNTMGAIKAITASNMALESNPDLAKVSLDQVVETMWQTAQDMNSKYKETSEGGLAIQISVNLPDC